MCYYHDKLGYFRIFSTPMVSKGVLSTSVCPGLLNFNLPRLIGWNGCFDIISYQGLQQMKSQFLLSLLYKPVSWTAKQAPGSCFFVTFFCKRFRKIYQPNQKGKSNQILPFGIIVEKFSRLYFHNVFEIAIDFTTKKASMHVKKIELLVCVERRRVVFLTHCLCMWHTE